MLAFFWCISGQFSLKMWPNGGRLKYGSPDRRTTPPSRSNTIPAKSINELLAGNGNVLLSLRSSGPSPQASKSRISTGVINTQRSKFLTRQSAGSSQHHCRGMPTKHAAGTTECIAHDAAFFFCWREEFLGAPARRMCGRPAEGGAASEVRRAAVAGRPAFVRRRDVGPSLRPGSR